MLYDTDIRDRCTPQQKNMREQRNTLQTGGGGDRSSPEYTLTSECTPDLPSARLKS